MKGNEVIRKLRLDVEAMEVESFVMGPAGGDGTVKAYTGDACIEDAPSIATCYGMGSCPKSACGQTCGVTMVNTCLSCTCWATGCPQC